MSQEPKKLESEKTRVWWIKMVFLPWEKTQTKCATFVVMKNPKEKGCACQF